MSQPPRRPGDRPEHEASTAGPSASAGRTATAVSVAPRKRRRLQRRTRWIIGVATTLVVLLVAGIMAWVGVTAVKARDELAIIRTDIGQLRTQLLQSDFGAAVGTANKIAKHAARAHQLTTGPAWWTSSNTPYLGRPFTTVRGVATSVDQLATRVLPGLISAVQKLESGNIRLSADTYNLKTIATLAIDLAPVVAETRKIRGAIAALPAQSWSNDADNARQDLLASVSELETVLEDIATSASVAPALLGGKSPKRYFVGFLNEAASRGLAGLPGAFGILIADNGKLTFSHFGNDDELEGITADVSFGAGYDALYGQFNPTSDYVNSNVSPHFPYAAQIWASMWQQKSGERVDGALALDATAMGYLLNATGPAKTADGTVVTGKSVVSLFQSTAYAKFGNDQKARQDFLLQVATAAQKKVVSGGGDFLSLIRAAARSVAERRLLMWTTDPAVQKVLGAGAIGGAIPITTTPYSRLSISNLSANKLDYYLDAAVAWKSEGCGGQRVVTVRITLKNNAPASGLSPYVSGKPAGSPGAGDYSIIVDYIATRGAKATSVSLDGNTVSATTGADRGHPVFRRTLTLKSGQSRTIVIELLEPEGKGAPIVQAQPMVRPMKVTVDAAKC